jgi:hypothetical protein
MVSFPEKKLAKGKCYRNKYLGLYLDVLESRIRIWTKSSTIDPQYWNKIVRLENFYVDSDMVNHLDSRICSECLREDKKG